jgi:hypothetical protein
VLRIMVWALEKLVIKSTGREGTCACIGEKARFHMQIENILSGSKAKAADASVEASGRSAS